MTKKGVFLDGFLFILFKKVFFISYLGLFDELPVFTFFLLISKFSFMDVVQAWVYNECSQRWVLCQNLLQEGSLCVCLVFISNRYMLFIKIIDFCMFDVVQPWVYTEFTQTRILCQFATERSFIVWYGVCVCVCVCCLLRL